MPSTAQERVAAFLAAHDLETDPEYRVLDLMSEVGEIAKEIETSTDYGSDPAAADVAADELGDVLFALLATAESVDVDAGEALRRRRRRRGTGRGHREVRAPPRGVGVGGVRRVRENGPAQNVPASSQASSDTSAAPPRAVSETPVASSRVG
nr:MazG-like family protein [Halomicrobium salinisoli]